MKVKSLLKNFPFFNNIKNNRQLLNVKNYFRTVKAVKQSEGQIKLESKVGIMLYDFIKNHEINDVLEIGTWNGRGSTKVLYESLKENKDVFTLTSIETDKIAYKSAKKYLSGEKINLFLGRIIEISDLPNPKNIDYVKFGMNPNNIEWFIQDIRRYKKTKNIFKHINKKYDFILFDGGEFSTFPEFLKLYNQTKYFGLDDIFDYKQFEVLKHIKENKDSFKLITTTEDFSIYKIINIV